MQCMDCDIHAMYELCCGTSAMYNANSKYYVFGFFLIVIPSAAGSSSVTTGTSMPHLTHMLRHAPATGCMSGVNAAVLTYELTAQSSVIYSSASQASPFPAKKMPHSASRGSVTHVPACHCAAGRGIERL